MPLQAAVQGAAAEVGDGVPQAAQHVVQWKQRLLAEGNHDGFLAPRQHRALRRIRTHRRIACRGQLATLANGLGFQAVEGGEGPTTILRRLGLGSNKSSRAGAAVTNDPHNEYTY